MSCVSNFPTQAVHLFIAPRRSQTGRPKRAPPIRDIHVPRRRIIWRKITVYSALYKSKAGDIIIIRRTLQEPPKYRSFRTAGTGMRKYKLIQSKQSTREVCIMAKATKTKKNVKSAEIEDDELEALESLDDLDDLEEEDEDEELEDDDSEDEDDEDLDEDDDDEDEAPAPKKRGKATAAQRKNLAKATAAKKAKAAAREGVGSAEVAEAAGCDARTLRMVLRKHQIEKDEDSGQYRWPSLDHKEVKKIIKLCKGGEAQKVKTEGLQKLKDKKAADKAAAEAKAAKKGGKKKSRKVVEDEDDDE